MNIKRPLISAVLLTAATAGAALATHQSIGLTSSPLGRGTWNRTEMSTFAHELGSMHAATQSDVFVVKAALAPGGTTAWHGHTGPSVVVVTAGSIQLFEKTPSGGCEDNMYRAGQAFFHAEGAHNFVNPSGAEPAEFLVTYFVPAGTPVTHDPDPGTC